MLTLSPFQAAASASDAPWWGVPVVAGGFLLTGAVLAFFFNLLADNRRAKRELANALAQEVLDLAAQLITAGQKFAQLGQRAIVTPASEFLPRLVAESPQLIDEHSSLINRFRLVMPITLDPLVLRYSAMSVSLTIAPYDRTTMQLRLEMQLEAERALTNALRKLRHLPELKFPSATGGQARINKFADEASERLRQHMEDQGVRIVDGDQPK